MLVKETVEVSHRQIFDYDVVANKNTIVLKTLFTFLLFIAGPLTYTTGGRTYVVGIVSWGEGCARPGKPGVYARVTTAMQFINQELSKSC